MAAYPQFVIRCKSENGSFILEDVNSETTVGDLKTKVSLIINKSAGSLKILSGYPPRALMDGSDAMTLQDVNIHSGETIIIQSLPEPAPHDESPDLNQCIEKSVNENIDAQEASPHMIDDFERASGIMMRHVVPSNNSCLFTSVYFTLSNGDLNPEKSNELRKVIARVVSRNPEKYNTAFLGMSNKDYCAWIQNAEHWGGAIELAILSEHFGMEIVAVDTLSLSMHRFGEASNHLNRVFLIYDGIHYDPLILELQTGIAQTIFPSSDDFPMGMALEIAREAQSSRQYTDVANFTLKCCICDVRLRGDTEARQHALATGHTNFGEITN